MEEIPKTAHYNFEIILFDGVCNFCNSSINFVIDHDPEKHFKFAPLQSEIGQEILTQFHKNTKDFDSVILLKNNQLYEKSEAALEITKHLSEIEKEKPVVIYCRAGVRSQIAIQRLQEKYPFKNLYNLVGGTEAWKKTFGNI